MTLGIERTFSRPFSETFRISKNEDFNGPYLENENEFLKNSFKTVFRASKSYDRGQLVSAFQLTFKRQDVTLGSRPCGKCSWCRSMQNTKEFKSISNGKTSKILHGLNCKSKWIVYLAKCTRCNLQYCGKAETQMNARFNNNRHHVKTKLKSCELTSHFIENPNHHIDRDLEITLIEQLRKTETMTEEKQKGVAQEERFSGKKR